MLFLVDTLILIKNRNLRWVGWALAAAYFMVLVLFGDLMRAAFDMDDDSRIFFWAIAVIYTVLPLALASAFVRLLPTGEKVSSPRA